MARQFIYHMQGHSKAWSGGKKVLDNINLSFYPDAAFSHFKSAWPVARWLLGNG
ncbi:MAG: hypothetical protein WEB63_09610 [Cucumibacter sp.]